MAGADDGAACMQNVARHTYLVDIIRRSLSLLQVCFAILDQYSYTEYCLPRYRRAREPTVHMRPRSCHAQHYSTWAQ
jgi:hypothetical protein